MKRKIFLSIFLLLLICTLTACNKSEKINTDDLYNKNSEKKFSNEELFNELKNKEELKGNVEKYLVLDLDKRYKGDEIFVLTSEKEESQFYIFSYDNKKDEFKRIFYNTADSTSEDRYFVNGVLYYEGNDTSHIILSQYRQPDTRNLFYFIIGQTTPKDNLKVLVDQALTSKSAPISYGNIEIQDNSIKISSNSSTLDVISPYTDGYYKR